MNYNYAKTMIRNERRKIKTFKMVLNQLRRKAALVLLMLVLQENKM